MSDKPVLSPDAPSQKSEKGSISPLGEIGSLPVKVYSGPLDQISSILETHSANLGTVNEILSSHTDSIGALLTANSILDRHLKDMIGIVETMVERLNLLEKKWNERFPPTINCRKCGRMVQPGGAHCPVCGQRQ